MEAPWQATRVSLTSFTSPDVPWYVMASLPKRLNNSDMFDGEFSLLHRSEGGLSFKRRRSGRGEDTDDEEDLTMRFDFHYGWPSEHHTFPSHRINNLILEPPAKTTLKFDTRFTKAETIRIAAMVGTVLGWTPVRSKNYRAVQEAMR